MVDLPMLQKSDVLIIGAGPAGASAAIRLAQAGWHVSLVEQHAFPRQKVCGECIAAGNFLLLDELGIGENVRHRAGVELERAGWMHGDAALMADMPACPQSAEPYGRALGRDVLDELLVERARKMGVRVLQPAKVRNVWGRPGEFRCDIDESGIPVSIDASIIIDAHGSWESGPHIEIAPAAEHRSPQRASDLFAFKATFARSSLPAGWLPVVAVDGGYGGLVVANDQRTVVALCVRRDALRTLRAKHRGMSAGLAVENHLRASCRGIRDALACAQREGPWLTVGPLRPGVRLGETAGIFRVGNAAGETHPLIGEGISMALQSSRLLVESLLRHANRTTDLVALESAQRDYARAWRRTFLPRLRIAALYAHLAMRPRLAATVGAGLRRWPALLTTAARCAGKARQATRSSHSS
jgi:flavin-dependent dehydrogenase